METLRGVFPAVPTEALLRVLEVCDQSVALASSWLLENDWQELLPEAQDDDDGDDVVEVPPPVPNATPGGHAASTAAEAAGHTSADADAASNAAQTPVAAAAAPPARTMVVSTEQEELDSEEEDEAAENEEDEDEEEDDMYYDSESESAFGVGGVPRLAKRVKMTRSEPKEGKASAAGDDFWVAFDDQVMTKSMIELLNTTLSKLAHGKVVLLNRPAKEIDETEASAKLQTVLYPGESESASQDEAVGDGLQASRDRDASSRGGVTLSRLLNSGSPKSLRSTKEPGPLLGSPPTAISPKTAAGPKRKRMGEAQDSPRRGFFAYFFPVKELDMVWRSVMHAHLFKGRFGETIEFHTASGGAFSKQDFDDLTHIQSTAASSRAASLGFSPLSNLKCCLLLPCAANEEEMFRVGQNIHSVLKVPGSIYYRVSDSSQAHSRGNAHNAHFELPGDDDKLTEERFRQFARYRVKMEVAADETPKPSKVGVDPYMSYQQPRKPSFSLETLEADKWSVRLST